MTIDFKMFLDNLKEHIETGTMCCDDLDITDVADFMKTFNEQTGFTLNKITDSAFQLNVSGLFFKNDRSRNTYTQLARKLDINFKLDINCMFTERKIILVSNIEHV